MWRVGEIVAAASSEKMIKYCSSQTLYPAHRYLDDCKCCNGPILCYSLLKSSLCKACQVVVKSRYCCLMVFIQDIACIRWLLSITIVWYQRSFQKHLYMFLFDL